ncbi:MAG: DUF1102 domain-containing protein [Halobacteriales archaeon]|nr:DUF1102 domain-containing protein [Halobacteriales archaeon]
MRSPFQLFLLVIALAAGVYAASAFNAASTSTRAVSASVVGDSAAYLALSANGASAHAGFVTQAGSGKIGISFGSGVATGTGVNPDATYYFDDLVNITNQGTASVKVQVNATATSGTVKVCLKTTTGAMDNSCYTAATTQVTVAVGSKLFLGVMVQANALSSGSSVSGTIQVDANR